MNAKETTKHVKNVAFLVFDILEGTIDLVAMREKGNQACEQAILPKCLTSWLHVQGVMSDVSSCRLHLFWSEKDINQLAIQH